MNASILPALSTLEKEHGVRILYACEAGSRAWKIEGADSDYDIRFIYVRPMDAYLRLDIPRDVIERPIVDDLDITGWDLFKAARLLRKSNPPLLEWLFSPVIYWQDPSINRLRDIARAYYSSRAVFYHYRHMALGNYRQYIQNKGEVLTKKYLYALRPIVTLLYLEQRKVFPPVSFPSTLQGATLDAEVELRIHQLIRRKLANEELGMGPPDHVLNAFIELHLERWRIPPDERESERFPTELVNQLILDILQEKC
jgi:predicted nucleotidyltransferase